ncbi:MAG: hypothetical protein V1898_01410 [Patescibacteria group bacterium]
MLIIGRLIPYISSFSILVVLELFNKYYSNWITWLAAGIVVIIISAWLLNKCAINKDVLGFTLAPLCLFSSSIIFSFFQENNYFIQGIILLTVFIIWLFFKNVSDYIYRPAVYISYSLENISAYSNLLSAFFIFV